MTRVKEPKAPKIPKAPRKPRAKKVRRTLKEVWTDLRAFLRKPETRAAARRIIREVAKRLLPGPEKMDVAAALFISFADKMVEPSLPWAEAASDEAIRGWTEMAVRVYLEEVYAEVHREDSSEAAKPA